MYDYGKKKPTTYHEFLEGSERHFRSTKDQEWDYRRGQAYVNYAKRWELGVDEILGTELDPFYVDGQIAGFLEWIERKLDGTDSQ